MMTGNWSGNITQVSHKYINGSAVQISIPQSVQNLVISQKGNEPILIMSRQAFGLFIKNLGSGSDPLTLDGSYEFTRPEFSSQAQSDLPISMKIQIGGMMLEFKVLVLHSVPGDIPEFDDALSERVIMTPTDLYTCYLPRC
jgi:hypothetical protein